jgi:hypothetical protein
MCQLRDECPNSQKYLGRIGWRMGLEALAGFCFGAS